jgi:hypothetical protein
MAFWLNEAISSEPKRNFRWYMLFGGTETDIALSDFVYALKKVDLPKASIKETEHQYLNHKFYYPGRLEWQTINITMASVTQTDAGEALYRALQKAGYGPPNAVEANSTGNGRETISKGKFKKVLGENIEIKQINSFGNVLSSFQLFNPFFTEVSWGSLDYTSEDITELSMTVRYDYAKYVIGGSKTELDDNIVGQGRPNSTVPNI